MSRFLYRSLLFLVVGLAALLVLAFYRTQPQNIERYARAEFGGVSLRIEFATTTAAREKGLGGRKSIPSDYGMLFLFPKDDYYGFWMKNTFVPLDMFWLDDKGQVVSIEQDVTPSTYPEVFYPSAPARYVLETISGFARTHDIATGTPFVLQNWPSVSE
ncbi:MAG: DUF192 domain-containing protein [Minisyncoccota bacterium]